MLPEVRVWTRHEMTKRVAFLKDLKRFKSGLPDSELPECERELINVIRFQPPSDERARPYPRSARMPPVLRPSRSLRVQPRLCSMQAGRGPLTHNHDTNETFMPITGRWRRLE
jgi:hypothetical protein